MKSLLRKAVIVANRIAISPILSLLHRYFGVEIQMMYTARIGHLCFNTCVYFYNMVNAVKPDPNRRAVLVGADPCNRQLFELWKRYVPIVESRIVGFWFNADLDYLLTRDFIGYIPFVHTEFREIDAAPALAFNEAEERKGLELLNKIGIAETDWFVCFQSRDNAYQVQVRNSGEQRPSLYSDIDTYMEAARLVTDRGGYAIRMGWGVSKDIDTGGNPRIIDYARDFRSDFGDIYLSGKCRFAISTTGLFAVPPLFKIPVIFANSFPLRLWPVGRRSMMVPKLFRDRATGAWVPASVLADYGALSYDHGEIVRWRDPATPDAHGLEVLDNTPEDIAAAAGDMLALLEGRSPPPEAVEVQTYFRRTYCAGVPGAIEHASDIAPSFALKYKDILCS